MRERPAEEGGAEALKFLDGVGGVEGAGGGGGGGLRRQNGGCGVGGGGGGIDDVHGVAQVVEGAFDEWFEQGIVGAAEDEGGDRGCGRKSFGEVDAEDLFDDRAVTGSLPIQPSSTRGTRRGQAFS